MRVRTVVVMLSLLVACGGSQKPASPVMARARSLPADASFVIGLDVHALATSAVWTRYRDRVIGGEQRSLDMLEASCGLNLLRDIQWAMIVFDSTGSLENGVLVASGAFDKTKIDRCLAVTNTKPTATDHGITQYGSIMLGWANPSTVVVASRESRPFLEKVLAGGTPSPKVAGMLARVKPGATLWAAGELTQTDSPASEAGILEHGLHALTGVGSLALGAEIDLVIEIDTPSPEDVAKTIAQWQKRIAFFRDQEQAPVLDRIKPAAAGSTATLSVHLDAAAMDQVDAMIVARKRRQEPPPSDDPPPPPEEEKPDDGN